MKKQFGPATTEIADKDAAEEHAKSGFAVFGIFKKLEGKAYEAFESVAKKNKNDMDFGYTTKAGKSFKSTTWLAWLPLIYVK